MRITNKIIQENNLSNINTNKLYQDKLSTQMSTEKKINRPSDDPVVAIRALRLRSNVTEVTQYYSKNIPDAESWLNVTEDALDNLSQILTNMISQCVKGSNGPLKTEDRQIILEQLKALGEEVYSTADADYAGRYVFGGYRTDTTISFPEETNTEYEITEQLGVGDLDSVTKVDTDRLLDINASNYMDVDVTEQDVNAVECYRIRLAYDDCLGEGAAPSVRFMKAQTDADGKPVTKDGKIVYDEVVWEGADIQTVHSYEDPYAMAAADDDAVIYVPETGELLLGKNKYNELMSVKDDEGTLANEGEIQVTYQKSHWEKGDLRPEHYFACTDKDKGIQYNQNYLEDGAERQYIEYDVGFNQTIRVNSTADECFQHGIGREVDDLVAAVQNVLDLENAKKRIQDLSRQKTGTKMPPPTCRISWTPSTRR